MGRPTKQIPSTPICSTRPGKYVRCSAYGLGVALVLALVLGACSDDPNDKGASGGAAKTDVAAGSDGVVGDSVVIADGEASVDVPDAGVADAALSDSQIADVIVPDVTVVDGGPLDVGADVAADAVADVVDATQADTSSTGLDGAAMDGTGLDSAGSDGAGSGDTAVTAEDVPQLACKVHADCPAAQQLCGQAACVDGTCAYVPVAEGLSCDTGTKCVTKATCQAGKCVAQSLKNCSDGNACTSDTCFVGTGLCQHTPSKTGFACDDGNACTKIATCLKGACLAAGPVDCTDTDPCTVDACDPKTGKCLHPAVKNGGSCDDGNSCSKGETCDAKGVCGGGNNTCKCSTSADCKALEDGNLCNGTLYCEPSTGTCKVNPTSVVACPVKSLGECQSNSCVPKTGLCGVSDKPGGTACDDGNPCTTPDECHGGSCKGLANTCPCVSSYDCKPFQTTDLCAGTLQCNKSGTSSVCMVDYSTKVVCSSAADSHCNKNTCDTKTGSCKMTAAPNGAVCSDAEACTVGDACLAGQCKAGADTCACTKDADCAKVEDGDACNGTLFCNLGSGKCDLNQASIVTCATTQDTSCAAATCQPATGKCELLPRNDGKTCDDGSACTPDEVCAKGACVAKSNTCACSADTDCAKLEDGNLCNGTLFCNKAKKECQHNPTSVVTCESVDDTFCRVNACIPQSGKCQLVPRNDGKTCDADGSSCTTPDVCNSGTCAAGPNNCQCQKDKDCSKFESADLCSTLVCDLLSNQCKPNPSSVVYCSKIDDSTCATNTCDAKTGKCAVTPRNQGISCDADGTNCTKGDACDKGTCQAGLNTCQCITTKDCAVLEDGNPCNGTLVCGSSKTCQVDPATVVSCQSGSGTNPSGNAVCSKSQCNAKTGKCAVLPANYTAPCGKATLCFDAPRCDAKGACAQGKPTSCDDGNPCTTDSCDSKGGTTGTGCSHAPQTGASCDDGSICTTKDLCVKGVCTGATKICDGGTPCTNASCHPLTGCEYEARKGSCSDGNKCTTSGACVGTKCVGVPVFCSDSNGCTTDSCHPTKGCVFTANTATCNDGNLCTLKDACANGGCVGVPLQVTVDCDDNSVCTFETCDAKVGCTHQPVGGPCADDDPCKTGDTCLGGVCKGGSVAKCDDANHCTKDVCDGKTGGCKHTASVGAECSDDNACTGPDACDAAGKCLGGKVNSCDDGKPCTQDACDPKAAQPCVHTVVSGSCDDGNLCTEKDLCVKGSCTGTKKVCSEGTACTVDSCHPTKGCSYQTIDGKCDDGDACTTADACKGKACLGTNVVCDDKNPCTDDSCNKTSGCQFLNNAKTCDDANACTTKDVCLNALCVGTPFSASTCSDGNLCTDDSCDKAKGCVYAANLLTCSDGDDCTKGDACKASKCVPGTVSTCTDNEPCTTDYCTKLYGCTYLPLTDGTKCDDGDPCTGTGTCKSKKCDIPKSQASGLDCDDANPCTTDVCSASAGCTHSVVLDGSGCSDGKPCTEVAQCKAGKCLKVKEKDCDDNNACTSTLCVAGKGCATTPLAENSVCAKGDATNCTTAGICKSGVCVGATARPWSQSVTGSIRSCRALIAHTVSGYLVVGRKHNGKNYEAAWSRVHFNGKSAWENTLPSNADARLLDASDDGGNGLSAVGMTAENAVGGSDGLFVRIDGLGKLVTKKQLGGGKADELWGLATETGGGHVLVGHTQSKGMGGWDGWIVRLDKNDNVLVNTTVGTFTNDYFYDVALQSDGSVVAVGDVGFYGGWVAHLDTKGALLKQIYDGDDKATEQHYRRIRRVSDDVLHVAGSRRMRTFNSKLEVQSKPTVSGNIDDFIVRPKGGYAVSSGSNTRLLDTNLATRWTALGNPGGGRRTLLAPDDDSLVILAESTCGIVRTDAFGNATCADSGTCRDKKYTDCVDTSLCTKGDTCKKSACTATSVVTCNDKKVCTSDACDAKTGKCVFTQLSGTPCSTSTSACAIAGKCASGVCYDDGVGAWSVTYLPFYGCCGDNNNNSNEYQGARATVVTPRSDGAIFLAGLGYNRNNVNSMYGRIFLGTGAGSSRYSFYDRKNSSTDAYADQYQVVGAASFRTLTSSSLTRYRQWTYASNKWTSVYRTVLMPNISKSYHRQLGDHETIPVDMEPLGDDQRAVSLTRHKVGGKWTFTVFITRHATDTSAIGKFITPTIESTWSHQFGDDDVPASIASTGDGGVVVAGRTKVGGVLTHVVARLDAAGKLVWKQLWTVKDYSAVYGVGWSGKSAIVTGHKKTIVSGTTSYFVWVRKYSESGVLVWDRMLLPNTRSDTKGFAVVARDTGFAIGARVNNQNALLRLSDEGHVIGDRRFGNTIYDWKGMKTGFVGVGYKQAGSSYKNKWKQNVYIVRTDAFGNTACTEHCKGKAYEDCDDKNSCTTDTCDTTKGCVHLNLADGLDCAEDGKICTLDQCVSGTCSHPAAKDGLTCESDGDLCTADVCKTGACTWPAAADATACEDGNHCTEKDLCKSGKCTTGTPMAQYTACNDGTKCTKNGKCGADGTCKLQPVCNDGKACTLDTCATDGTCTYSALKSGTACDDGNYCTEATTCDAAGACVGGKMICNETVLLDMPMGCTTTGWKFSNWEADAKWAFDGTPSSIKPVTGTCTLNFNNGTLYDGRGQAESPRSHPSQRFGRLELRYWSRFESDVANDASRELRRVEVYRGYSRKVRYDNKSDVDQGKWHEFVFNLTSWRNSTKNGNYLRFYFDDDGDANRGKGWFIDDLRYVHQTHPNGEPCSFDNTCNDGDQCTTDLCVKGHCVSKLVVGLACTDGSACTEGDACSDKGTCVATKTIVCEDNDVCTANSCHTGSGCYFPGGNDGAACDDGNTCTAASVCSGGSCYAKTSCDDHNACTTDSCGTGDACTHVNVADGVDCGGSSSCKSGVCTAKATGWASAIAGYRLVCGLLVGGKRACWALNDAGMIGDGVEEYRPAKPSLSLNTPVFTQLAIGEGHSCGIVTTDGEQHVWCMGSNSQGQLGVSGGSSKTWTKVAGSEGVQQVAANQVNTCALRFDGTVRCWGYGNYGILTGAKTLNSSTPVPVAGLKDVRQISMTSYGVLAAHIDGSVSSWGSSSNGTLGNGQTSSGVLQKPTKIAGLTNVRSVYGGKYHGCAVKNDGTAWCWGANWWGSVGDDTKTARSTPVQVKGLTTATSIAVSERTTCALKTDGGVTCWGDNTYGALGDGSTTERLRPMTNVSGLSGVVQLARTFIAPCALKSDGSVYCWGYGKDTGDGTGTHAKTPVLVSGSK